jgi:hypothetical protein
LPAKLREAFKRKRHGKGDYDPDGDLLDVAADRIDELERLVNDATSWRRAAKLDRDTFLSSRQKTNRTEEPGYVIERGDSEPSAPLYFVGYSFRDGGAFGYNHMDAIRFCRKEDAQRVVDSITSGAEEPWDTYRVCEHVWDCFVMPSGGPPPDSFKHYAEQLNEMPLVKHAKKIG